ncbi:Hypothetical protein FKW44_017967 [Caligus rogercresseyi]|uniref:Uncharacterized protein n=1 Tax=Caligus rogercresseyi TaxID=217165 RepID=A0A7T8GU49_CALRO|nr:Hypothetical protein FKW44_017967 [Caligus rogercresseyi]
MHIGRYHHQHSSFESKSTEDEQLKNIGALVLSSTRPGVRNLRVRPQQVLQGCRLGAGRFSHNVVDLFE